MRKVVRYHCRKNLADNRIRYLGRFISKEQMAKILQNNQKDGMDNFFDPIKRVTPKTKKIFKVDKYAKRVLIDNTNQLFTAEINAFSPSLLEIDPSEIVVGNSSFIKNSAWALASNYYNSGVVHGNNQSLDAHMVPNSQDIN